MPRPFTLDEVDKLFEDAGCVLKSSHYKNREQLLDFICSCGHTDTVKLREFLDGVRCKSCRKAKKRAAFGFNFEYVKQYFRDNGCELLEETYENTSQKLRYICKCGKASRITFRKFRGGQRCASCGKHERLTIEIVRERFNEKGYQLLDDTYVNAKSKLKYKCSCGNISHISVASLKKHSGCHKCVAERVPCSTQQRYVSELIGGELNYPFDKLHLDIAFPDEMTYLECDFSGHWLTVDFNWVSMDEFVKRETARRRFMNLRGWREVRLISKHDRLPDPCELKVTLEALIKDASVKNINASINIDDSVICKGDYCEKFTFKSPLKRIGRRSVG